MLGSASTGAAHITEILLKAKANPGQTFTCDCVWDQLTCAQCVCYIYAWLDSPENSRMVHK